MCWRSVGRVVITTAVVVGAVVSGLPLWIRLDDPSVAFAEVVEIGASRDNTLYEHSTGALSNGAGEYFFAGTTNSGEIRRGLIAFDVAGSIPPGAEIAGVTLTLQMSRTISGATTIDLHPLVAGWGEGSSDATLRGGGGGAPATIGDATWVHRFFDTDEWTTRGGDFSGVSASASVGGLGSYTWESTPEMVADVQSWLDDPASNFGWLLKARDESVSRTAKRFDSRDNQNPVFRPRLSVEFSSFRRGDANNDGALDVSDAVAILEALFLNGAALPCADAADVNDDSVLDISDSVTILLELFGDAVIPDPGSSTCGVDPTEDELECAESATACG